MKSSKISQSNWSDLLEEILEMIYGKLIDINDIIHIGGVCSSWRSFVQSQFGKKRLPPQLPLIMYPKSDSSLPYHYYCIKSIHCDRESKEHTLSFPINNYICLNSSQGWVLVLALSPSGNTEDHQFYLINPFLSDNNSIQLPSPSQLVHEQARDLGEEFIFYRLRDLHDTSFISKMVLSDNPLYTSDYTVVLIFCSSRRLAFFRSGNSCWTFIDPEWFDFQDVVFCNDRLYAISTYGYVSSWDVSQTPPIDIYNPDIDDGEIFYDRDDIIRQMYLVELSGELVCVRRYIEFRDEDDGKIFLRTVGFRIFKLNQNVTPLKWIELRDLGGHMLFLGENSSLSLLASDFHMCRPNQIFFTDDKLHMYISARIDTGVFNIADGSFQWFFSPEKLVHSSFLPFWIQPSMNIRKSTDLVPQDDRH